MAGAVSGRHLGSRPARVRQDSRHAAIQQNRPTAGEPQIVPQQADVGM